jgi:phospholipase C
VTHVRSLAWIAVIAVLAACAPGGDGASTTPPLDAARRLNAAGPGSIGNVIFIVQADRSFNDLFEAFPGTDTASTGRTHDGREVALKAVPLSAPPCSIEGYGLSSSVTAWNHGEMNGWDLLDSSKPVCPYTYVRPADTKPYWQLAKAFTIGDHTFSSSYFGDFVAMQYLIAGSTKVAPGTYVIGVPNKLDCDAPAGTTSTVLRRGKVDPHGPFPCFSYPTIANLLDAHHVTWKWYAAPNSQWNPWAYIRYVRTGPDWKRNVSIPETNVFSDLKNGTLASVSWVTPSVANSDDPASGSDGGPEWVKSVVTAVRHSKYWSQTAIVVVWNDAGNGQFYDPIAPPQLDVLGLGFRVPLIAISPFARNGYVAHAVFQNGGSTLRFVEQNWKLGSLGTTDASSTSVGELFTK